MTPKLIIVITFSSNQENGNTYDEFKEIHDNARTHYYTKFYKNLHQSAAAFLKNSPNKNASITSATDKMFKIVNDQKVFHILNSKITLITTTIPIISLKKKEINSTIVNSIKEWIIDAKNAKPAPTPPSIKIKIIEHCNRQSNSLISNIYQNTITINDILDGPKKSIQRFMKFKLETTKETINEIPEKIKDIKNHISHPQKSFFDLKKNISNILTTVSDNISRRLKNLPLHEGIPYTELADWLSANLSALPRKEKLLFQQINTLKKISLIACEAAENFAPSLAERLKLHELTKDFSITASHYILSLQKGQYRPQAIDQLYFDENNDAPLYSKKEQTKNTF